MRNFKWLSVTLIFLLMGIYNGMAQNYLDVPPDPNYSSDYLNKVIYGDTTSTGDRVADRVYRLEPGGIYYFNNIIKIKGDLKIVAEGQSDSGFDKAIILTGTNDQGNRPGRFAETHGDVVFKNLYFSCVTDKDKQMNDLVRMYSDSALIDMENCFVEWPKLYVFRVYSSHNTVIIKDSYFRNITGVGGPFNGKILGFEDTPAEKVVMQNNTMVNIQGPLFKGRFNTIKFFKFDHNTVVNTIKWPFHFEYWTNGEVTNNIFFNTAAYGENKKDASNQDPEGLMFGIINLYTVPDSLLAQVGLHSQSERKLVVKNNLYYFDQKVKDYLADWWQKDSVKEEPWMNERTKAWADDDTNFPYIDIEDPITDDPGFFEYPTPDSMIKKMDQWRTDGKKKTWWWVDDDGDKVSNATDRPHNLAYSTDSPAYTAADGGFPLGDLNWFPDKKEEWVTAISDKQTNGIPSDFSLLQNYPNPFNPTTKITFLMKKAGRAQLTVYNVLGEKVITLANKKFAVGKHSVVWKGLNEAGNKVPSGIYLCRFQSGKSQAVIKMVLVR